MGDQPDESRSSKCLKWFSRRNWETTSPCNCPRQRWCIWVLWIAARGDFRWKSCPIEWCTVRVCSENGRVKTSHKTSRTRLQSILSNCQNWKNPVSAASAPNRNLLGRPPNLRHFPRWFGGLRGVRQANPKLGIIVVLSKWQIFQMMLATVQQQTKVDEIPFGRIEQ